MKRKIESMALMVRLTRKRPVVLKLTDLSVTRLSFDRPNCIGLYTRDNNNYVKLPMHWTRAIDTIENFFLIDCRFEVYFFLMAYFRVGGAFQRGMLLLKFLLSKTWRVLEHLSARSGAQKRVFTILRGTQLAHRPRIVQRRHVGSSIKGSKWELQSSNPGIWAANFAFAIH